MTLSKGMSEFLRYHQLHKGGSAGTAVQYERTYRSFLAHLKGKGCNDEPKYFSAENVLGWALAEGERGVGPRTLAARLCALSSLARFLMRLKDGRNRPLLDVDPTKTFERPKYTVKPQDFLYPEELRAFLAVERPLRESIARDLFLDTMLRVGELVEADVSDFTESEGRFLLTVKVKGGRVRTVPVSPAVGERVKDYLLERGMPKAEAPLLANSRGERWTRTGLTQLVTRIARQAGITRFRVSAHKLRHTANVVARRAGLDVLTRSALLNHSDTRTLSQYDHLLPDELVEARVRQAEGLAAYLGAAR